MKLKLETDAVRKVATFVKATGIQPKDCIQTKDCIYFVLDEEKMAPAIGKNASVVKKLRKTFGKNVRFFAYKDTPEEMVKSMVPNVKNLKRNGDTLIINIPHKDKSRVIGRRGRNVKAMKKILRRHFDLEDLKVRT